MGKEDRQRIQEWTDKLAKADDSETGRAAARLLGRVAVDVNRIADALQYFYTKDAVGHKK